MFPPAYPAAGAEDRVGKMHPDFQKKELNGSSDLDATLVDITLPNTSSGIPIKAIMLLWSEVFKELGRERVGALLESGGEPQSSRCCNKPSGGIRKALIEGSRDVYRVSMILGNIDMYIVVLRDDHKT